MGMNITDLEYLVLSELAYKNFEKDDSSISTI